MALTTRADLLADSEAVPGTLVAQRAVTRMRDTADPMPPLGHPRPSTAQIDAFAAWVTAGMPMGTCEGAVVDPVGPTCTRSAQGMKFPVTGDEGPDMNPGLACRACHIAEEEEEHARFFMGTVFPTLHEQDRCYSNVPAGTVVEILDETGTVRVTMMVRARGNFMSPSTAQGFPGKFTARVRAPSGAMIEMKTPQESGDCNSCHTEQGANGAPGRILLPMN